MVIRMMVLMEKLVLHRSCMMLMLLLLPIRRHVHTLILICLLDWPIQGKKILTRNMMLMLAPCLGELLWMVVGS
jgi:hypothetical protein